MSGLDLAGLRAAAEAATSGPWVGEPEDGDVWGPLNRERICRTSSYAYGADATFIAAASPDVVLALVERVEEAEQYIDMLTKARDRAEAAVERVEALAAMFDQYENWQAWGIPSQIRGALNPPKPRRRAASGDESAQQVEVAPEGHPSSARAQSASSVQPMPSPYAAPVGDDGADGGRG